MGQKSNSIILRSKQNHFECDFKYMQSSFEESTVLFYKSIELKLYTERLLNIYGLILHSFNLEYSKEFLVVTVRICSIAVKPNKKVSLDTANFKGNSKIYYLITNLVKRSLLEVANKYYKCNRVKINVQDVYRKFYINVYKSKKSLKEYKSIINIFRKFLKSPFIKKMFIFVCISVFEKKSAKFLATYICMYFAAHRKKHNYLLSFLKKSFESLLNSYLSKMEGVKIQVKGRLNGAPRAKTRILQVGQIPLQTLESNIDYCSQTAYTSDGTFGIKVWFCYKNF